VCPILLCKGMSVMCGGAVYGFDSAVWVDLDYKF